MGVDVDWDVLQAFTGSERLYRWWCGGLVLSEGVHYLTQHGAAWLVDIIASTQGLAAVRAEEFQLWELELDGAGGCTVRCRRDAGGRVVYEQAVEYTDFPRDFALWCTGGTVMLPAEY